MKKLRRVPGVVADADADARAGAADREPVSA